MTQFSMTPDFLKLLDDKSFDEVATLVNAEKQRRMRERLANKSLDERFDPRNTWD